MRRRCAGTPRRSSVGASAGLALLGALDTPAEVLARADAAMYARKAERNTSARGEGVTKR